MRMTLCALLIAASVVPAAAQRERDQIGILDCDVSPGVGFIFGSSKEVRCMFTPSTPGPRQAYIGRIDRFGLDVGVTGGGHMVWAVHALTNRRRDALAGSYAGATAEATVAVGLGANVLVGGSDRSIALQPLSVQTQTGLNLAAGIAELTLSPAR